MSRVRFKLLLAALLCACVSAAEEGERNGQARYTFSWPLTQDESLTPRGGTTRGPAVTLDRSESPAWRELHAPDISAFERDRRAILAMAGTYRVTFDFLEVLSFANAETRERPYQSWGTEKVYVDRDEGKFISLVHILEMRLLQEDGSVSEPMVTKHWRQDWRYEPTRIVEYVGRDEWRVRDLKRESTRKAWSQTVYQVDESPRYASLGQWRHSSSFSSWASGETWRPLPRREWSVRKDYDVLIGTNTHSVMPWGWVQEENNLKAITTSAAEIRESGPYVAREYGFARYDRLRDVDFSAADRYYERTRHFWNEVRQQWAAIFVNSKHVKLKGPVDQLGLYRPLFAHADRLQQGDAAASTQSKQVISAALRAMGGLR